VFWYISSKVGLSHSQILFHSPNSYSLGNVQRFCCHSWWNSTFLCHISNNNNVSLSSSLFWTNTFLVIFYHLPSFSRSRIPPKMFDRFIVSFPQIFCTNTCVSDSNIWTLNKILWSLSVHFCHLWRIQKIFFTTKVKTRTLSKINQWNSVYERILFDST